MSSISNAITESTLAKLATRANEVCQTGIVYNLILYGVFLYSETESEFIKTYARDAKEWQEKNPPKDLYFNHGMYIHKYGDGLGFLVEELRKKKDSNRACLSLVNMGDLINSQDNPIPSFLILQFGFPLDSLKKLLITAYFRALEVSCFLPINLAEISYIVKYMKARFPDIEEFELSLIAFKAYCQERFHCLKKAQIDIENPKIIMRAVLEKNLPKLEEWINSKLSFNESIVCTDGLYNLYPIFRKP